VHDWLFVTHHCIEHNGLDKHDERDRMDAELVRKIDFRTSADILAGVIQALEKQDKVPKRPLAPGAIYIAVDSIVAKNVWDNRDPESCRPVEQEKLENIAHKLSSKSFRIETVQPGAPPTSSCISTSLFASNAWDGDRSESTGCAIRLMPS
jgi:hypothetical protein